MAHKVEPRTAESSSTSGTGNITGGGAYDATYGAFSRAYSVGDTFPYYGVGSDGKWERGIGTIVSLSPTVFSRSPARGWNGSAYVDATLVSMSVGGSVWFVEEFRTQSPGANIASAATVNLDAASGSPAHITGTTTITAITLTQGLREVIFDGALTLTHHATNNNLPGAANINTVAGDRAIYAGDGTTVYCVDFIRAADAAVTLAATQVLTNKTLTAAVLGGTTNVSGGQLQFPASQSASADPNCFDDYEEGTWTPVVAGVTSAGVGTYTSQSGAYTKVGRLVTFVCRIAWSAHTGTGDMKMTGLPFTAAAISGFGAAITLNDGINYTSGQTPTAFINGLTTEVYFLCGNPAGFNSAIAMDAIGGWSLVGQYYV